MVQTTCPSWLSAPDWFVCICGCPLQSPGQRVRVTQRGWLRYVRSPATSSGADGQIDWTETVAFLPRGGVLAPPWPYKQYERLAASSCTTAAAPSGGDVPRLPPVLVTLLHDRLALGFEGPDDLDVLLRAALQKVPRGPIHGEVLLVARARQLVQLVVAARKDDAANMRPLGRGQPPRRATPARRAGAGRGRPLT